MTGSNKLPTHVGIRKVCIDASLPVTEPAATATESPFALLLRALREFDNRNESTPCQTPGIDHLWTSDDAEDREAAAHRCQPCPLRLAECMTYATTSTERHHVWAGLDLTERPKGKKQ